MRNVILCEGSTDYFLLQYFMRTAYQWEDSKEKIFRSDPTFSCARTLVKDEHKLTIAGTGGCNKILLGLERVLETNFIASNESESFQKIAIIVDRDELDSEEIFRDNIESCLRLKMKRIENEINHNQWIECFYDNAKKQENHLSIIFLVIPFEDTGAMETFLLKAVAKSDSYDERIIDKCNSFVDDIDPEKRYLNKRRYVTKSKFDVYFSVRTAVKQFEERQNILKSVPWEKYVEIQESFKELEKL